MGDHRTAASAMKDVFEEALSWIVAPLESRTFVESYLSRAPLRVRRDGGYYAPLLSEKDLEYVLYAAARVPGALEEMLGEDRPRRCAGYTAAMDAYRHGKSLRVNGIQRFSRNLTLMGRALEQEFSCPVNINMYLTPAGRRALSRHYDTHDVFVLQILGRKRWRIFDSEIAFPLEYLPPLNCEPRTKSFRARKPPMEDMAAGLNVIDEFVLEQGDMLYLPRGFWHEAEAEPGHISCHLTIGTQSLTYVDLFTVAVAQAAASNPDLRRPLPPGFATHADCRAVVREHTLKILSSLPDAIQADRALEQVAELFLRSRAPIDGRPLDSSGSTSADIQLYSEVRMPPGVVCGVSTDETSVHLLFGSTKFSLPASWEPVFRFIVSRRCFTPEEIPGDLDTPSRIALVRQLLAEGLLVVSRERKTEEDAAFRSGNMNGWLPIHFRRGPKEPPLQWMRCEAGELSEPFFGQSVTRLRAVTGHPTRRTGVSALSRIDGSRGPSGFIFHISRCGSTLLANAMRKAEGTVVISEAQPIGEAVDLAMKESGSQRANLSARKKSHELLRKMICAFAPEKSGDERALLVKFSSWNILALDIIRSLWPDVPIVMLIRDPAEVMVSLLQQPPGWMQMRITPSSAVRLFGFDEGSVASMTNEEYCARGIGQFLGVALANAGPRCRIIDYTDINIDTIRDVAEFLCVPAPNKDAVALSMATWSKDPGATRKFADDRQRKQSLITDLIRAECDRWARAAYSCLRRTQFAIPGQIHEDEAVAGTTVHSSPAAI